MPSRCQIASAPDGANIKSGLTILSCALPSADKITRRRNCVPGMARLNRSIVEIIIGRSRPRSAVSGTPIVTTGCISPLAGTVHLSPLPIVTGVSVEMDAEDSTSTLSKSKAESPETSSGSASAKAELEKASIRASTQPAAKRATPPEPTNETPLGSK